MTATTLLLEITTETRVNDTTVRPNVALPPGGQGRGRRLDADKEANPVLLSILVISITLIFILTLIYLIRKSQQTVSRRRRLGFEQASPPVREATRPPRYDEAVKASLLPPRLVDCEIATGPPPSYEEAQRYVSEVEGSSQQSGSCSDYRK